MRVVRTRTASVPFHFQSGIWLRGWASSDNELSSFPEDDIVRLMLKYGSWRSRDQYTPAKRIRRKGRVVLINRYDLYRAQEMWGMNHERNVLHPRLTGNRIMYFIYHLLMVRLMQDGPGYRVPRSLYRPESILDLNPLITTSTMPGPAHKDI
jgi:hypothetical protein